MPHSSDLPPIRIEVAFALAERQVLLTLDVPTGTTALEAVRLSSVANDFPGENFTSPDLGVFARPVTHEYVVQEGDRVEIYRPLTADPKEVRRALAAAGLTMGARD